MIKVLNIISDTNIGGAGRCVLNFLKYYDRDTFEVKVVMPQGSLLKPEVEKLHTPVIEVAGISDKSLDLAAIGKLKKIITAEKPAVVHTHGTMSGRIAARFAGAKVVYTRHSVFPVSPRISKNPGRTVNRIVNEYFSDAIIAVAEAAKDNLTEGGIRPERVQVILNGVEPLSPLPEEEKAALRREYGIAEGDFVVGILARLNPVKGHSYLIDAAAQLKAQGRPIKVLIAGVGDAEADLKAQTAALHLEDTVKFLGFVQDVKKVLSVMDVQANASYGTEATSLALLEGMSLGIPAVVSDYGGNPGVISDGENGFLFPTRDAAALADRLARLMDAPALYEAMRENALGRFRREFTADHYARNIESVYLRLAGAKR